MSDPFAQSFADFLGRSGGGQAREPGSPTVAPPQSPLTPDAGDDFAGSFRRFIGGSSELDTLGPRAQAAAALMNPAAADPERAARALAAARRHDVPADAAARNLDLLEARGRDDERAAALDGRPGLTGFIAGRPELAPVIADDLPALGLVEGTGAAFKRGVARLRETGSEMALGANARIMRGVLDLDRRLSAGESPEAVPDIVDPTGYRWMSQDEREALKAELSSGISLAAKAIGEREAEIAATRTDPAVERALSAEDWTTFWDAFTDAPAAFIATVTAESLPVMAPGLIAAGPAGLVAGATGAAATMGVSSYAAERSAAVLDGLRREGVNLQDESSVRAAVADQALMERVEARAAARAAVVSVVDAASMGVAAKTLVPGRAISARLGNVAAQMPLQGAMGAMGEAGGSLAAGEAPKVGEVAAEFFGELGLAPVEVGAAALGRDRAAGGATAVERMAAQQDAAVQAGSAEAARGLHELVAAAEQTRLAGRDRATLREFLAGLSDSDATVHIDGDALRTLYQDGEFLAGFSDDPLAWLDDLGPGPAAQAMAAIGGGDGVDVAVNLADYVAAVAARPGLHGRLKPGVRAAFDALTPAELDALTPAVDPGEAAARTRFAAGVEQATDKLATSAAPDTAADVEADVREQLVRAGAAPDVAGHQAALWGAFFRTMSERIGSERMGADAGALYRGYGVEIRRAIPETIKGRDVDQLDLMLDSLRGKLDQRSERDLFGPSLLTFIAERGGVVDHGGDLTAMDAHRWHRDKKGRRKLLSEKRTGKDGADLSLDATVRAAWEAGYFSESVERPDINVLLEAVREELRGRPRYAEGAGDVPAQERRAALGDLERTLDQLGLDVAQLDNDAVRHALFQGSASDAAGGTALYQGPTSDAGAAALAALRDTLARIAPAARLETTTAADLAADLTATHGDGGVAALFAAHGETPGGPATPVGETRLTPEGVVIKLALDSDPENWAALGRHEAVHALKRLGLFQPDEWAALEAAAREEGWTTLFTKPATPAGIEEAIADAFAEWGARQSAEPAASSQAKALVERLHARAAAFLRSLRDALNGRGVARWEQVFADIEAGRVGGRASTVAADESSVVANLRGDELAPLNADVTTLRTAVREYYRDNLRRQGVFSNALGGSVIFTGAGAREAFARSGNPDKLRLFAALRSIIENGRLVETSAPDGHKIEPNTRAYHRLAADVDLAGRHLTVEAVIREDNNGHLYYDHRPVGGIDAKGQAYEKPRRQSRPADQAGGTPGSLEGPKTFNQSMEPGDDGVNLIVEPADLRQSQGQSAGRTRGSIRFDSGRTVVTLFQTADLSTFLHESGHFFLEAFRDLASGPDAHPAVAADWAALAKALKIDAAKIDDGGEIPTEAHERFARGFEAWLMEGRAPSTALQSAFARFKAWLKFIYQSVARLNVAVTPEISDVMARMFATDAEIAAAERAMRFKPLAGSAAEAGLTEAEYQRYLALGERATREAEAKLFARAMQEESARRSREWRVELARVKDEVAAELRRRPVNRALAYFRSGRLPGGKNGKDPAPAHLDRASLIAARGEAVLSRLPHGVYRNEGGKPQDVLAYELGFDSGDALVDALMREESRRRELRARGDSRSPFDYDVDTLAEQRMEARHGHLRNDGAMYEAAIEAAHGDARGEVLAAERRILARMRERHRDVARSTHAELRGRQQAARALQKTSVDDDPAYYRAAAEKAVGKLPVNLARQASRHERDEINAALAAEKAVARGDMTAAVKWKHRQSLAFHMAKVAREAAEEIDKTLARFRALAKPDAKLAEGSVDIDHIYAARAILARFGILAGERWDFKGWLNKALEADPQSAAELSLTIKTATAEAQNWKTMPLDDLRGLRDVVNNLIQVGRNVKTTEIEGRRRDTDEVITELLDQVADRRTGEKPGQTSKVTDAERLALKLAGLRAAVTRVEHWARLMDGGSARGAFTRYLVRPVTEAIGRYNDAKRQHLRRLLDLIEPRKADLLASGRISAPELGGYTFANKGELLHAIAHTGNASNMEKLLLGRNWRHEGWRALINRLAAEGRLTKADFDLVQGLWDLLESMKGAAQQAHRKMYGFYFDEVTARPLQTPFGVYRGGYMPAAVDRMMIEDGQVRADADVLKEQDSATLFPTTGRGFTKTRSDGYTAPLELNLMLLPAHIDKVLRFTHLEPSVKAAARIVMNGRFKSGMHQVDQAVVAEMLIPWLQRVARQSVEKPSTGIAGRALDQFARTLRKRAGLQFMAGNIINALQQVTGISSAAVLVRPAALARGLIAYTRSPGQTAADVAAASAFMRSRLEVSTFELVGRIEEAIAEPGKLSALRRFGERHGYFLQQAMQNVVDVVVWLGAHDQALAAGMAPKDAVFEADSAVRRTQGSFAPEDISRFEAGSPFARLFTMFVSYFNTQLNLLGGEVLTTLREAGWRGGMGRLFSIWFVGLMIPSVAAEALVQAMRGELGDDDDDGEELLELFAGAQARYIAALVPGAGQVATMGLNLFNDHWYDDRLSTSPVAATIESTARAPFSLWKALFDDGLARVAVKDTLTAVGMLTGLPLAQAAKPLGAAADLAQDRAEVDGPLDLARALISGRVSQ